MDRIIILVIIIIFLIYLIYSSDCRCISGFIVDSDILHRFTLHCNSWPHCGVNNNFKRFISVGISKNSYYDHMVDSGGNCLIYPYWEHLENTKKFKILTHNIIEPFGCKAHIVQGDITVNPEHWDSFIIKQCIFYACYEDRSTLNLSKMVIKSGLLDRTSNFGLNWSQGSFPDPVNGWIHNADRQAPLKSIKNCNFVEIDYNNLPKKSYLILYKSTDIPKQYKSAIGINRFNHPNMAAVLTAEISSLEINQKIINYIPKSIVAIDSGGGPFMFELQNYITKPIKKLINSSCNNKHGPDYNTYGTNCYCGYNDNIVIKGPNWTFNININSHNINKKGIALICDKNNYLGGSQNFPKEYIGNVGGFFFDHHNVLIDYRVSQLNGKIRVLSK